MRSSEVQLYFQVFPGWKFFFWASRPLAYVVIMKLLSYDAKTGQIYRWTYSLADSHPIDRHTPPIFGQTERHAPSMFDDTLRGLRHGAPWFLPPGIRSLLYSSFSALSPANSWCITSKGPIHHRQTECVWLVWLFCVEPPGNRRWKTEFMAPRH